MLSPKCYVLAGLPNGFLSFLACFYVHRKPLWPGVRQWTTGRAPLDFPNLAGCAAAAAAALKTRIIVLVFAAILMIFYYKAQRYADIKWEVLQQFENFLEKLLQVCASGFDFFFSYISLKADTYSSGENCSGFLHLKGGHT